jgi:hypothetical protein
MSNEFKGSALKITENDLNNAAEMLGCDVAAVKSVVEVESAGGGFFKDKRPKILFESRWFGKLTKGKFHSSHPHLSTRKWVRNYKGGTKEYGRLEEAMKLDRDAALKSTSWGMFQILGVNHKVAGYPNVEEFVAFQVESEGAQLKAFVNFVKGSKLDDELRDLRWADFARGYNGPGYKRNRYDTKLANAYEKHSGGIIKPSTKDVQTALNKFGFSLTADGVTGPKTRNAIREFQREQGLVADGVAGPKTLEALGLGESGDSIVLANLVIED